MKYVFTSQIDARVKPNVILVKSDKTANYNDKSWTVLGPKIWNQLPQNINQNCVLVNLKKQNKSFLFL